MTAITPKIDKKVVYRSILLVKRPQNGSYLNIPGIMAQTPLAFGVVALQFFQHAGKRYFRETLDYVVRSVQREAQFNVPP